MTKFKLSKDEKELLDAVEAGEFESVLTETRKKELKVVASNALKKDKKTNNYELAQLVEVRRKNKDKAITVSLDNL